MGSQNLHVISLMCIGFVVLNVSTCAAKNGVNDNNDDNGRGEYKLRSEKKHDSAAVERFRQTNRLRTLEMIDKHNQRASANDSQSTNSQREKDLSDMTYEEYVKMLGFRSDRSSSPGRAWKDVQQLYHNTVDVSLLPTCVNWTAKGWVGPVSFQGLTCGSCWAHATVGSLQAQLYNVTGRSIRLSAQNLIDCSYSQGNMGCEGGNMVKTYQYVANYGIESLDTYPDTSHITGTAGKCRYNALRSETTIDSFRIVDFGNELALQQAVALYGPVVVAIDAMSEAFMKYDGPEVYTSNSCGSNPRQLNHAVLVVGYGVYDNQSYWLIQNSWGTKWGINGYMMLARNANNLCGIATEATFPILDWKSTPPTAPVSGSSDCIGE